MRISKIDSTDKTAALLQFLIGKGAASCGPSVQAEVVAAMKFDLPATYKFHKQKSVDVEVGSYPCHASFVLPLVHVAGRLLFVIAKCRELNDQVDLIRYTRDEDEDEEDEDDEEGRR